MTSTCPKCHCSFPADSRGRVSPPTCADDDLYPLSEDPASSEPLPAAAPVEPHPSIPTVTLVCPVCGHENEIEALVCVRCGAGLHRKYLAREDEPVGPSSTGRAAAGRRRLLTVVLVALAGVLLGTIGWMIVQLLRVVETPSVAYQRMAGMARNGDWERYCERIHPRTLRGMAIDATDDASARRAVVTLLRNQPELLSSLFDLVNRDFSVEREEIQGDRAWVHIIDKDGRRHPISMEKDGGIWKVVIPSVEGPGGLPNPGSS